MNANIGYINKEHINKYFEQSRIVKYDIYSVRQLGAMCIRYAQTERVPRYTFDTRENDAEHSNMLAIMAVELASTLRPGSLDLGLISQFAAVHDMVEIEVGDTPTFHVDADFLAQKADREHKALQKVLLALPPYTAGVLERYEAQDSPEALWVRASDKIMPLIVDIEGEGSQVMREDYHVESIGELKASHQKLIDLFIRRFGESCPELVPLYKDLCTEFEKQFYAATLEVS